MSEIKYLKERQYLQKLAKTYAKDKPHLAAVLEPEDPQTNYLMEGFAFLSAHLQEKIDDAFPEITLPLLQRLGSQAIKGVPSTSIVQIMCEKEINYSYHIPKNSLVLGHSNTCFSTCRDLSIEPYSLVDKRITHQPNKSCISLTFSYIGNTDSKLTCPINLFLSPTKSIADTLLLGLNQYFDYIELKHADKHYYGDSTNFYFEPKIGKDYPIFPQSANTPKAPQQLMEGLYLPHVHHFIDLDIPTITKNLDWEISTEFTVNIYLKKQISLTKEQCEHCFLLNCVPVVDKEKENTLIIDFQFNKSSYLLPIPKNNYLSNLSEVTLS